MKAVILFELGVCFGSNLYKYQPPKMKESVVVSMTGFVNDPNQDGYKQMIKDLRMRLAPILSEETSVLIVNDVTTQKYKIAKTYDTPISCVSIEWLLQCCKTSKRLPTANFQIRKLFYGADVKIVGYEQEQAQLLRNKINHNGGKATILNSNNQLGAMANSEDRTSLILTNRPNFAKLKHYLEHIPCPIVDIQWAQDSLKAQVCKYPFDYALNQGNIYHRQPIEHYSKMKKKLDLQLSTQPIEQFQPKILENTFIYLAPNINTQLSALLKKLIMVFGGFYLEEHSPIITHILTEPITEQQYLQMKVYGVLVYLLRVQWLIDSIYIHKHMKEEQYQIRSFKANNSSSVSLEDRQSSMMGNSMSLHSLGAFGNNVPSQLTSRKSISKAKLMVSPHHTQIMKVSKKFQSHTFKGHRFYIESTHKRQIQLHDLSSKIIKNGGEVCNSRADIRQGHCFYILKDSGESEKLVDKIRSDTRGHVQLQPLSYRWINDCLAKAKFVDPNNTDSYIYKPFNFKTPIFGFQKMIFEVLGVQSSPKSRLKQLYNTLGSARNMVNKSEITHCLCGTSYRQSTRYSEIKKQNKNVKYVSWKWLIECSHIGKIIQIEPYLMEKQTAVQPNENQNINLQNIFGVNQKV